MPGLTSSLRRLACCIGRERLPSTTEPDAVARFASCSPLGTASRLSTQFSVQNERKSSPEGATEAVCSALESLPVEIQIAILAESSLESLRALINSSPRFYHVYFRNRTSILNKSLKRTLGGIFQDARAACRSERASAEVGAAAAAVRFSFEDYLESLRTDPTGSTTDGISLAVAQRMAHFHLRVVEPLTERYACWALGALSSSPDAALLTRTEKARIQRSMYRLQIICNMSLRGEGMILGFLDRFGPWQAEEIVCVHAFAMERYPSVFIECAWELDQERNPKYRRIPLWEVNERLLLYSYDIINREALATILSLGLTVLRETFEARNSVELAEVVETSIGSGEWVYDWHWIDSAVGDFPQEHRRHEAYSKYDEAQDRRQEVGFERDDLLLPPLAWVSFWDGRYSNLIGIYVPPALHRWGYVMWDAKRLNDSGAMGFVELEWQCMYGARGSPEEDDPREIYCSSYDAHIGSDG